MLTQRGVRGGGAGERLDTLGLKLRGGTECPEGLRRPPATQQRTPLREARLRVCGLEARRPTGEGDPRAAPAAPLALVSEDEAGCARGVVDRQWDAVGVIVSQRRHGAAEEHLPPCLLPNGGGGGGGGGVGPQQLAEQLLKLSPVRHVRAVPHQPAQLALLHPVAAAREVQCLRSAAPAVVLRGEAEAQRVVARVGARGGDAARGAALEASLRVREQRRSTLRLPAVRALHRAEEAGAKEVLLAALERERRRGAAERLVRAAHEPASQEAVGHGVEGRLLVGRQLCAGLGLGSGPGSGSGLASRRPAATSGLGLGLGDAVRKLSSCVHGRRR